MATLGSAVRQQPVLPRIGSRSVSLAGFGGKPQSVSVDFIYIEELNCYASGPVGAARRSIGGKWFARWLVVPGNDLAAGRVELRTEIMSSPALIERWWNNVPTDQRAEIDNDSIVPYPLYLRRRASAVARYLASGSRLHPLDASCGYGDLLAREKALRAVVTIHPADVTEADLWGAAVSAGQASQTEMSIAYSISRVYAPNRWGYSGD
jgi:hypothetical protein